MKILGLITARGGSKRIPRKNIRKMAGKPLIAWTIDVACQSSLLEHVIVSTDDTEIASVARAYGADVPFVRPAKLAGDSTPHIECVMHALDQLASLQYGCFDAIVLLQPTSPLRLVEDIDGLICSAIESRSDAMVSVSESLEHPYFIRVLNEKNILLPIVEQNLSYPQKQNLQTTYFINGAVYFNTVKSLQNFNSFYPPNLNAYLMPQERSLQIDNEHEFVMADLLLSQRQTNQM